jgi:hypothetical protein
MSTVVRISVWEEEKENPSNILEQPVKSESKSVYVGFSVSVLFGLIALAVVITLWIHGLLYTIFVMIYVQSFADMNSKTTVTVTTTSTTATTSTTTTTTTISI